MKRMIFPLIGIVLSLGATAQYTEFKQSQSGLIYSDTTVKQLKFIVDSLNLRFRICELNKDYYSFYQSKAHSIKLEDKYHQEAMRDMDNDIPLLEFLQKYNPKVDSNLLVIRYKYTNYKKINFIEFYSVDLGKVGGAEISYSSDFEKYEQTLKGKWLYNYYNGGSYTSLSIFYIIDGFHKYKIPEKYARMIQYADCMVDTNTQIYAETAQRYGGYYEKDKKKNNDYGKFMSYINRKTNKPKYDSDMDEEDYTSYYKQYTLWDSIRISLVDSIRLNDKKFNNLFMAALAEVLDFGGSEDQFEEYVARYYSAKTALELKRNRIVVGSCSQDESPRVHALNIAKLSAESISWEVFLRAHLDIMNDRFDRASDGSYAWAARKTYIKELEILDINVNDLLFGISLRIENPSKNHYFGSIGRLGRALSESAHSSEIEAQMLEMMVDNSLDNYNKVLIYYLYLNYVHNLDDKKLKDEKMNILNNKVQEMPDFLATRLVKN